MEKELHTINDKPERASSRSLTGKIARLPHDIREQLNQRLLDGQPASTILPWLNELPMVKEILATHFGGDPVIRQNLDNWRHNGYQEWFKEWKQITRLERIGQYASKISHAGQGKLAEGAAAIVSSQILELLDAAVGQHSLTDLNKTAFAVSALRHADHNKVRLKHGKKRLTLSNSQLALMWDKHQRDVVAIAQRLLNDDQAKAVQSSELDNSQKIELIGYRLFGKLWQFRRTPEYKAPESTAPPQKAAEDNLSSTADNSSAFADTVQG